MDANQCVLSAARAVLDLAEREWQPLSEAELEQRLDQAVEEIFEAELIHKVKRLRQSDICVTARPIETNMLPQVSQATTTTAASREEVAVERPKQCDNTVEETAAVKYITAVLQGCKSRFPMTGRARLALSQTVPLCLTLLSERVSYRALSRHFHLEKGNIHRIFFYFCQCVNMLEEKHICWPVGSEAEDILFPLSGGNDKGGPCVPRVLGVLGHTRIPVRLPIGKHDVESTQPEAKRMKKAEHPDSWLHLELVCDRAGRFLHCRIGKGQDTDRGVTLSNKLKRDLMTPGSVLLARAGYPLTAHILTPYTGSCRPREELLNATLEPHLRILDQAVANLKARFQRLLCLDIGNYSRARAVVLTACVLHNILLNIGDVVHGEAGEEEVLNEEGEKDEEGVHQRDAIAELLCSQSS
ncbi:uncharacterized protein LOC129171168 [Dunckerocampus dactyliophorus]|uniref:uncharacterized protein LOC129171168 n=1 Tax=Dunckerocampus dactyliophorus TaxID=161453 RepID=UPI0024059FBC|nr:uncharacterized protein LOC129171168 [Dunckerocampus dactyliophorus]